MITQPQNIYYNLSGVPRWDSLDLGVGVGVGLGLGVVDVHDVEDKYLFYPSKLEIGKNSFQLFFIKIIHNFKVDNLKQDGFLYL